MGLRIAEINEHPVAHVFRDKAGKACDRAAAIRESLCNAPGCAAPRLHSRWTVHAVFPSRRGLLPSVRVMMDGIEAFRREISSKNYPYMKPGLETMPWGRLRQV
jgi:hypothetical protein